MVRQDDAWEGEAWNGGFVRAGSRVVGVCASGGVDEGTSRVGLSVEDGEVKGLAQGVLRVPGGDWGGR